jgi:hypothetical protein
MQYQEVIPHPLRDVVKKARLKLYEIQRFTGVHESTISRMLNGISPMNQEVEAGIRELLEEIKKTLVVSSVK